MHEELQDTTCDAWRQLLQLIDEAARDGRAVFTPREDLGDQTFQQIVTLPTTIAKLKEVRVLRLYGTSLVRLPPEIGEMSSLEEFDPYTSYRLHWFPYEITRCPSLRRSRVSTRALYGNYNYRPPFPLLKEQHGHPATTCSVCGRPSNSLRQYWISLRVATDVLPLLLSTCSKTCLDALPRPSEQYVQRAHRGGTALVQPPPR